MRLGFLLPVVFIILYGVVGSMAFKDVVAERDYYCDMVESGAWPAYRGECE